MALTIFALLGLMRAGLLELLDPILGPESTTSGSRVLTNVTGSVILLALIAVLVDDARTYAQITRQLTRAQESIRWLGEQEPATLRAADLDQIAAVRADVEQRLLKRDVGASSIREISEGIVRMRSHYLATTEGAIPVPPHRGHQPWNEVVGRVVRSLPWPRAVVLAALVELLVIGPVATTWGWPVALANASIAGILIAPVVTLARRFVPLPQQPWLRVLVLLLSLMAIALFASASTSLVVTALIAPFPNTYVVAIMLMVLVGGGVSTWDAVTRDRQEQKFAMVAAVAEEADALERIHGEVVRRRHAAADFIAEPVGPLQ